MKGKSQFKRLFALAMAFALALSLFAVPVSASTVAVRNLAGQAVTAYSAPAGSEVWLRVEAPAGSSVTTGGTTIGVTRAFNAPGGPGTTTVPADGYVWMVLTIVPTAATGVRNMTVSAGGASVPLALTITAAPAWDPGLVASGSTVVLGTAAQEVTAAGTTVDVNLNISRPAGVAGAVTVNAVLPGGVTIAGGSIPAITGDSAVVTLNVPEGTHSVTFNASGAGVAASSSTIIVVADGGGGGVQITGSLGVLFADNATAQVRLAPVAGGSEIIGTVTGASFVFDNVPAGTYTLHVTKTGHLRSEVNSIVVGSANMAVLNGSNVLLVPGDVTGPAGTPDDIVNSLDYFAVRNELGSPSAAVAHLSISGGLAISSIDYFAVRNNLGTAVVPVNNN